MGLFLFIVPARLPTVYMSPDETAVAVAAREFGTEASFRLEDKILEAAPWIHPRSWVTDRGSLVPVGFLGMPLLAGILWRIFGELGLLLLTPLLALSAVFPLWRFLKNLGWYAQVTGLVAWLSFPTVILYANRGLFPNLVLVCLMVWSAYLVWERARGWHWFAAGVLFGLAGAIRPTELPWMLVWVVGAWLAGCERKPTKVPWRGIGIFLSGAAIFPLAAAFMAWRTYGTPFTAGYWLRDPAVDAAAAKPVPATTSAGWPFGFHPRNVWFNLKGYVFGLLAPWVLVSAASLVLWLRARGSRPPIVAGIATAAVLSLVYGQAIYQDHVGRDIVSVGNSFLRYLLPLAPFAAASAAGLVGLLARTAAPSRTRAFALLFAGSLALTGIWTATDHDDEGLRQVVVELDRYEQIRRQVFTDYGRRAIVLSDRSDKIFFPVMRAASPLPEDARIAQLAAGYPEPVLLFDSAYGDDRLNDWLERGFVLLPVLQTKNQMLYEIHTTSSVAYPPTGL